ncbi:hypothetical protein RCL_jg10321.t1 [Rhizophagus clarus]|uniref:Uncharacterized protein n=1 Tax=Rhizophagus clarus TaxID=94130 RepID=A0A8H3QBP8_9GLOM|nr:hypothetical protein RCL_jg10321.t1 [Rhizophagus clarus]
MIYAENQYLTTMSPLFSWEFSRRASSHLTKNDSTRTVYVDMNRNGKFRLLSGFLQRQHDSSGIATNDCVSIIKNLT